MSLRAINAYQKDTLKQQVATADPHQLTTMLMQGALDRLAYAKGAHERQDLKGRSEFISKATAIFINLRDTLNMDVGGEISQNLHSLYNYMIEKLISITSENAIEVIDEIFRLFSPIKQAWVDISEADKQEAYALQRA